MTREDLAFAAGLMEGEGSVRINKATKRNLGHLVCAVTNTNIEILDWLQARWPGYMKGASGLRPDQSPAWVWVIAARKAAAFLAEIEPFVITDRMKRRIALAREFQAQKRRCHADCRTYEYRETQWIYFMEMKELNLRGAERSRTAS